MNDLETLEVIHRLEQLNKHLSTALEHLISVSQYVLSLTEAPIEYETEEENKPTALAEVVTRSGLRVRTGPGTQFDKTGVLPFNTRVFIYAEQDGWGQLEGGGWISLNPSYTSVFYYPQEEEGDMESANQS